MADDKKITVWVTKYALTKGVYKVKVTRDGDSPYVYQNGHHLHVQYIMGRNAFLTSDEAIAAANKMRSNKVVSLTESISKLHKLDFFKMVKAEES